jgi:hypothetical protein
VTYVESSALVAAVLEGDAAVARALDAGARHVASAMTFAEARRAMVRARVAGRIDAESESWLVRDLETRARRCELVAVTPEVLGRAGRAFPIEPVRTLDAIHLATLELLALEPTRVRVATRDARIAANAAAMGYPVVP